MNQEQISKQLGITAKTYRHWIKEKDMPSDVIIKDQVIWIINSGLKPEYAIIGEETDDIKELRKDKLREEITVLRQKTDATRSQHTREDLEQIRNEAEAFLQALIKCFDELDIDRETAVKINGAVKDSLSELGK